MFNLPRPSRIRATGDYQTQINNLVNYLDRLVAAIERPLNRVTNSNGEVARTVMDISVNNGVLRVKYTDGSVREINI